MKRGRRPVRSKCPRGHSSGRSLNTLPEGWGVSLWGEKRDLRTLLTDGDRIEVAAPILIDPKERRRRRAELLGDVRQVTCGRHGGKHRLA